MLFPLLIVSAVDCLHRCFVVPAVTLWVILLSPLLSFAGFFCCFRRANHMISLVLALVSVWTSAVVLIVSVVASTRLSCLLHLLLRTYLCVSPRLIDCLDCFGLFWIVLDFGLIGCSLSGSSFCEGGGMSWATHDISNRCANSDDMACLREA